MVLHLPRVIPQLRVALTRRLRIPSRRGRPTARTFASTTTFLPPGSLTTTSGVRRPSSVRTDSLMSKCVPSTQAGALEHAAQLELSPLPADVRRAQRARELAGFGVQDLLRLRQRAELFGELRLRAGAAALDVVQLGVDLGQRLAQRLDQRVDRLLPSVEIDRRGLLELAERGSRELEERSRCSACSASDDRAENASRSLLSASCSRASFSADARRSASSAAASAAFSCRAASWAPRDLRRASTRHPAHGAERERQQRRRPAISTMDEV